MKIKIEDERKFRVIRGPVSTLTNGVEITQGYLSVNPPVRVRIENFDDGFLTKKIKIAPGLNIEDEDEIGLFNAKQLMRFHKYHKVRKTRYKVGRLEIDVFLGRLNGLVLIEFEKEYSDEKCEIPVDFLVEEVTGDERFENNNLCQLDKLPEEWRCQDVAGSL